MGKPTREEAIAVLHRNGLIDGEQVAYYAKLAAKGRRPAPTVSVYAVARRLAALERVVDAARQGHAEMVAVLDWMDGSGEADDPSATGYHIHREGEAAAHTLRTALAALDAKEADHG